MKQKQHWAPPNGDSEAGTDAIHQRSITALLQVSGDSAMLKVNYENRAAEAHCLRARSFRIEAFGNAGILAVAISRLVQSPLLLWQHRVAICSFYPKLLFA
ncbi:hypothetical protein LTR37_016745 [Vermiconidia calcicola]|uniref:Uncharacterized protein n=1 Tax=Vermiconidia calcicola TaxID=1690605 RepID=A0ACC3MN22_9PEZI|nr:hypothetical protein LTR37_016745 [Vermiconidia calcicola]